VSLGQWSEPLIVPADSASDVHIVVTSGDTLWVLQTRGWHGAGDDSAVSYASWGLGDSWSVPVHIGRCELFWSGNAAVDHQNRVWYVRYDGMVPWADYDTWGLVASMRDAAGWHDLGRILLAPGPTIAYVSSLSLCCDRAGSLFMGIQEHLHESGGQFSSAMFSYLDDDTWVWPRYLARGSVVPERSYYGPSLAPRPDSGLWAVCMRSDTASEPPLEVYALARDTANLVQAFEGDPLAVTADSWGRLWVFYTDFQAYNVLRSASYRPGAQVEYDIVTTEHDYRYAPAVCADNEGWVWCIWSRTDSTLAASYNRGDGWSQAEQIPGAQVEPLAALSDSRGRIHIMCRERYGSTPRTMYRRTRPGVEEGPKPQVLSYEPAATVLRSLPAGALVFDAMGRRVVSARPGVYFVRAVSRELSAVSCQKVVLQR
jgi:hypothetical protein